MKKLIYVFAIVLQSVFLLLNSSCEDENHMQGMVSSDYGYSLSFSKNDIAFKSSNSQTLTVEVNSNDYYDTPWRLEDIPSWITVSQTSGKGPKTITIKAAENKSNSPRNGTISLCSRVPYWSHSVKLNLSQAAMPEYVDLGLSVNWATCNVGASVPEEYGDYFAWGETQPKSDYSWSTYKYCKGIETTMTKYCITSYYGYNGYTDGKTVLDLEDDAAHVNWGGNWRMPTSEEQDELLNTCAWTWTTINGVSGFRVVSKVSGYEGISIFLPAAGRHYNTDLDQVGFSSYYMSSSLSKSDPRYAYSLYFNSAYHRTYNSYRYVGLSVRPVCPIPATGISLNKQSVEIMQGGTETLIATVLYENGTTDNTATWTSSNTSIATVDQTGKVTAISVGTCTITASSGSFSATCSVTVKPFEPTYVDLGLSVKWATCNVGATAPEDYGDYFAWGETSPKSDYRWSTLKYCNDTSGDSFSKYNQTEGGTIDNKTTLDPEDDAAHVNWGGSWRMPTMAEFDELRNSSNCTWTWTTLNGVNGYKVVSKVNGNSIFLPAAGYRSGASLFDAGSYGLYWSSSLGESRSYNARYLYFFSDSHNTSNGYFRSFGKSVRPVLR